MTMSKLTLTAPKEIIAMAEEQARRENTSISAMFVNFIKSKNRFSAERYAIILLTENLTLRKKKSLRRQKPFMRMIL